MSSKAIKSLMIKLGYEFIPKDGKWIKINDKKEDGDNGIGFTAHKVKPIITPIKKKKTKNKRSMMYITSSDPWNRYDDVIVKKCNIIKKQLNISKLYLQISDYNNIISIDKQISCLNEIYKDQSDISTLSPIQDFDLVNILKSICNKNAILLTIVCDDKYLTAIETQITDYKQGKYKEIILKKFKQDIIKNLPKNIEVIPTSKLIKNIDYNVEENIDSISNSNIPTIPVSAINNSITYDLVENTDKFSIWCKEICPTKYLNDKNITSMYFEFYHILKQSDKSDVISELNTIFEME